MVTRSGNVDNITLGPWQCHAPGAATCQCSANVKVAEFVYLISILWLFLSAIKSADISELLTFVKIKIENDMFVAARSDVCSASSNFTMFAHQVILFSEGGVYQLLVAKHLFLSKYLSWMMLAEHSSPCWDYEPVWEAWLVMPQPGSPHSLATHKLVSFVFANISQTHNLRSP